MGYPTFTVRAKRALVGAIRVEFELSPFIKLASAAVGKVEHLRPRRLLLAGFEVITVGRFSSDH